MYKLKDFVTCDMLMSVGFEPSQSLLMKRYFKKISPYTKLVIFDEYDTRNNTIKNTCYNHAFKDVWNKEMYQNTNHNYILPNIIYLEQLKDGYDCLEEGWVIQDLIEKGWVEEV